MRKRLGAFSKSIVNVFNSESKIDQPSKDSDKYYEKWKSLKIWQIHICRNVHVNPLIFGQSYFH